MKMRKRMLVSVMAAVLTLGSALSVWAEGSRTSDVTVVGEDAGKYIITSDIEKTEAYKQLEEEAPEVVNVIDEVNKGTTDMKGFAESLKEMADTLTDEAKESLEKVIDTLDGKDFVTGFFDLIPEGNVEKNENGNYQVTMSVPALTDKTTEVEILHYSVERKLWENIKPLNVDKKAKTVTAEFKDLSPVAIIAKEGTFAADLADQSQGTSPKTEGVSVWMMWAAAAVILSAGAAAAYRQRTCR